MPNTPLRALPRDESQVEVVEVVTPPAPKAAAPAARPRTQPRRHAARARVAPIVRLPQVRQRVHEEVVDLLGMDGVLDLDDSPPRRPASATLVARLARLTERQNVQHDERDAPVGQRRPARARSSGRARPSAPRSGRTPVDGPRMVRRINIDGDDQADRLAHGGEHRAVFVYQIESYRYWERELGRDDFTYGQFGENFTVDGLADDEVCIGDRYRIGEALFEVTQPRVTCYRVGIRMDEPAMPSLLVAHHRPGLLPPRARGGRRCEAGDAIVKVADGPGAADGRRGRRAALPARQVARAARARAARPGAQRGLEGQLPRAARQAPTAAARARLGRLPAAARRRDPAARARASLVPARAGRRRAASPAAAGPVPHACACGRTPTRPPLLRSYSLSDVPGERGYRISVKREGAASRYLHERREGRRRARRRRAARRLRPARPGDAAGRADQRRRRRDAGPRDAARARRASRSTRPVWWLHGARNRAEHAFARRGRRAARRAARRPPPRRLQPPGRGDAPAPATTSPAGSTSRPSTGGRPRRRRLLPLRTRRLHARDRRRAHRPRRRARARRHRGVRRRRRPRLRHRQGRRPPAPPPRRPAGHRPGRHVRPQQPRRRVGRPLPEPARPRRGLRRPGRLRLPHTASATTARAGCSRARSPTPRTRSSRRPTAASSSAAAAPRRS